MAKEEYKQQFTKDDAVGLLAIDKEQLYQIKNFYIMERYKTYAWWRRSFRRSKCIKKIPIIIIVLSLLISCTNTKPDDDKIQTGIKLTEKQIGTSGYFISIPNDYSIKVSDGPDFSVYYFSPSDTTVKNKITGGLYFGNYPSIFESANDSCKTEILKGKILGNQNDWTVYNCGGDYSIQTIADNNNGEEWNRMVHAFGHGKNKNELRMLLEIYATLKKK